MNMTIQRRLACAVLGSLAAICLSSTAAAEEAKPKLTYVDHVVPILREHCFGCHNPDKTSGGLNLTTYGTLMTGGGSGEVIAPGDAEGSYLYQLVTHESEPVMPPNSAKLADAKLATIKQWIADGALENSGSKPIAKKTNNLKLVVTADGKPEGPPPMPPQLVLEPVVRTARDTAVTALAASPWAPLVAVAGQQQVLLYHADSLELLGVLPFPEGVPHVLKFSRSGKLLLAGGGHAAKSGKVVVWDVTTGQRVIEVGDEFDSVLAADISADQSLVALGGSSKVVRVFSTATGELAYELKKHTEWIYAVEFSPDGVLLATADRNGGMFVWEAAEGREYLALQGHQQPVTDLSWRVDSNLLASGSEDGSVKLWEMNAGNQVKTWGAHGGGVTSVEYARDGRIATCGRDRVAKTWDGEGKQQRQFDALADLALHVAWKDDGARLVAAGWTGEIRVWNSADGKMAGQLTANPPKLAERLDAATKELAAQQVQQQQLVAALTASQAAFDKANADMAAAQKAVDDLVAAEKAAQALAAQSKQTMDAAATAVTALQGQVQAKAPIHSAASDAAAKAQQAAAALPGDAPLADAAGKLKVVVDALAAQIAESQKAAAEQTKIVETSKAQIDAANQAAQKAATDAVAARKQVEQLGPAVKAATDKLAADKAAADAANAAVATAQAAIQKWNDAIAFAAKAAAAQPAANSSAMAQ